MRFISLCPPPHHLNLLAQFGNGNHVAACQCQRRHKHQRPHHPLQIFSSSSSFFPLSIAHRIPCFTYLDVKFAKIHTHSAVLSKIFNFSNRPIVSPRHRLILFKFFPVPARRRPFKRHGYPKVPTPVFSRMYAIMDYLFFGRTLTHEKMSLSVPVSSARPRPCAVRARAVLFTATDLHYIAPDADG